MSVQEDMFRKCRASRKARPSSPPWSGELEITQAYLKDARGSSPHEKYNSIKADASTGCKQGCMCQQNAQSRIVVRRVGDQDVEYVVSVCGSDPNAQDLGKAADEI